MSKKIYIYTHKSEEYSKKRELYYIKGDPDNPVIWQMVADCQITTFYFVQKDIMCNTIRKSALCKFFTLKRSYKLVFYRF